MKYLFFALLTVNLTQAFANDKITDSFKDAVTETFIKRNRGEFKYPIHDSEVKELSFLRKLNDNKQIQSNLASIKYQIINGNLEKAKLMLLQSKYTENYSKIIQYRYLSIIHFIEGEYEKSLSYLTKKEMYNLTYSKHLCLLRTLNYIILNRVAEGTNEWNKCVDATLTDSPTSHLWMSTLVKLKLNDEENITDIPFKNVNIENEEGNFLKLFLKLALYLNKQDKILDRIDLVTSQTFQDPEIRELMGMLFYRKGKILNAYRFVEDLNTPNAENIKGNIYLTQKKYELAYAQFKLALMKKVNSQNSLERIIPVAWLLKEWASGIDYVEKLVVDPKDEFKRLTVKAAFETENNQFKEAEKTLKRIVIGSRNSQAPEVNQLYSYNALMLKDNDKAYEFTNKSCLNQDGISCWLQFHLTLWENFSLTIHRDEQIREENQEDLLSQYSSGFEKDELKEDLYVNQKDIEELDNSRIVLLPKNE